MQRMKKLATFRAASILLPVLLSASVTVDCLVNAVNAALSGCGEMRNPVGRLPISPVRLESPAN
jgi:hypothetical protein